MQSGRHPAGPGPAERRKPASPPHPPPTPRPPLSLRCALKSQMGREERGSPRPAPSPHLDKHAPPARPPAPDRRAGGRDGQAAGAARQRLTSKRQRPPAGGALIRPGCRRPAICSALERAPMGAGAAGIEWQRHRLSELGAGGHLPQLIPLHHHFINSLVYSTRSPSACYKHGARPGKCRLFVCSFIR